MNLFLRFLGVISKAFWGPRMNLLDVSVVSFRVWLNDIDVNGHMNNGRYLTIMDLGSLDAMIRTGLIKILFKRKWRPIIASSTIRFRRSLKPFEKYQLYTHVLYWDQKWLFIEQRFERKGELIALGMVKGLFRGPNGNVPPAELFKVLGYNIASPPTPEAVAQWLQSETLMLQSREEQLSSPEEEKGF
jgi:acyl-CoA thioesterase FadM